MKTYDQVHASLYSGRGVARTYDCSCGARAIDWALQPGGQRLVDEKTGLLYSRNLEDYAPMCRRCHIRLDDPDGSKHLANSKAGGSSTAKRWESDPEGAREQRSRTGKTSSRLKRRCLECGLVSSPASIGSHQKFSSHVGWEDVR